MPTQQPRHQRQRACVRWPLHSIVGDFNDWRVARHPLEMTDGQNWHITLQLARGTYQYKFFIDGIRWEEDPQNPNRVVNEFGTSNSILEVQ